MTSFLQIIFVWFLHPFCLIFLGLVPLIFCCINRWNWFLKQKTDTEIEAENPTMENIISNFDFSEGLNSWNPNSCHAYVAHDESSYINGIRPNSGSTYAIVTERTQNWHGLEQDITDKITPDMKYTVSSYVTVSGEVHAPIIVSATLKLKNHDNSVNYLCVGRYDTSHLFNFFSLL